MPKGMHLKSDGFASDLSDPGKQFTLEAYCKEAGLPYQRMGLPVSLDIFSSYGLAFQERYVPQLEQTDVTRVARNGHGFVLTLSDGSQVHADSVVIAVGIADFAWIPERLTVLGHDLVSHSTSHPAPEAWRDKQVAVLGAGSSAADLAALLHEAGASVEMIVRGDRLNFHQAPTGKRKSWLQQILRPDSGLGPGWKSFLSCKAPLLFHALPQAWRLRAVSRHLGPSAGWFIRNRVEGKLPVRLNAEVVDARAVAGRVQLELSSPEGVETLTVDHLIAATGFRMDLRRMRLLDPELAAQIRCVEYTPVLDRHFGSSVPDLYFVGAIAANSFGPLLRFAYGAQFAAERVAHRMAGRN